MIAPFELDPVTAGVLRRRVHRPGPDGRPYRHRVRRDHQRLGGRGQSLAPGPRYRDQRGRHRRPRHQHRRRAPRAATTRRACWASGPRSSSNGATGSSSPPITASSTSPCSPTNCAGWATSPARSARSSTGCASTSTTTSSAKGSRKLADVVKHYGVSIGDAHNADADALAAARLAWKMPRVYPELAKLTIPALMELQKRAYREQRESFRSTRAERARPSTTSIPTGR